MKSKKNRILLFLVLFFAVFSSCTNSPDQFRKSINLSGTWQFSLDTDNRGIEENWFMNEFNDSVQLPGTTDINRKGIQNHDTTTMHLNRIYRYEGAAWYRKEVFIPENWANEHIQLVMERTKPSKVWIDDQFAGSSILLESAQIFDLSKFLSPGKHVISIRIDNNLKQTPYGNVHIYSDDTQTNWNGIIGKFYLEASDPVFISDLQVYPDVYAKKVEVKIEIGNPKRSDLLNVEFQLSKVLNGQKTKLPSSKYTVNCDSVITLEYEMGDAMDLWDDYQQPIYELNAIISGDKFKDNKSARFGMRKFAAEGTRFSINGRKTFLRGKHDACVFPLTGHPPMDTEGWLKVFRIAKDYGINHYRFHSWCPPEAAFEAADHLGIFIQAELPFWGGLDSDSVASMLQNEGIALMKSYANHPSFVMFSPGNEIWSGFDRVEKLLANLKEIDSRPLYTQGSNNSIGYAGPMKGTDFQVAARTPSSGDTILTHTRLTHAFADSKDGATLNTQTPSANIHFNYSVEHISIPIVSHEIGQYQIFPDYSEIEKYTGVFRAWNLEVFRKRLFNSGMMDQNVAFQKASGAWAALCYKAEMEAALRTAGFGGFQLLDLQDFPGQGTALVGILDAFMDSKNVVSREDWLQSCNDVVTLLVFDKYCWTSTEQFSATVEVANYSNREINSDLQWSVTDQSGNILEQGVFKDPDINPGRLQTLGKIEFPLSGIKEAQKLSVKLNIDQTKFGNSYPVWVYPEAKKLDADPEIAVVSALNNTILKQLHKGGKVLLMPDGETVRQNSVAGLFPPEFWNYGMFKGISEWVKKPVSPGTLGLLMNPEHPLFKDFPTDSHTNWQWFSIIKASHPLNLNLTEKTYRPIVQVIDNLERNNKYGLIFEFKVGEGKLLICMSKLNVIQQKPEAAQLYQSILRYMKSTDFQPQELVDEKLLGELFQ
ncbi:MAG: sugar-binding domain-containing protein [Prolixibacteraceae bacterium]